MHVTFSMELDGASFSNKKASFGDLRTGPAGFLDLLETCLALSGTSTSAAERINQYRQRLEDGLRTNTLWSRWYETSFTSDSWSTARQILAWRDELIEAGWSPGSSDINLSNISPRLNAITGLEEIDRPLSPGTPERLHAVIRRICSLPDNYTCGIEKIELIEPAEYFPVLWRTLLDQFQSRGCDVSQCPIEERLPKNVILVESTDEREAAVTLSRYLSAADEANMEVALIVESSTDILDQELSVRGLPCVGNSESSAYRTHLQILPLIAANLWRPADVRLLADLLGLPQSPVPKFAGRILLQALESEPGLGGKAWLDALGRIREIHTEHQKEKTHDTDSAAEKAQDLAETLDRYLHTERFDPSAGVPSEKLRERCEWVKSNLSKYLRSDPSVAFAINHATVLAAIAQSRDTIPKAELDRIIASIIGSGTPSSNIMPEASAYTIASPAQVNQEFETLIWWNFTSSADHVASFWNQAEMKALYRSGIRPETSLNKRQRESYFALRAIGHCKNRLILIRPRFLELEETGIHPIYHELEARLDKDIEKVVAADCIDSTGTWSLAGRSINLHQVVPHQEAEPIPIKMIQPNSALVPEKLSYTQLNTLIACPMKWAMEYQVRLSGADLISIPIGNHMLGTFIHRIVEELYSGVLEPLSESEVSSKVIEIFDREVPHMAAELLLPGNAMELHRCRNGFVEAIQSLNSAMIRYGLRPRSLEKRINTDVKGIPFTGFIDFILETEKGESFIIDLKWSTFSKYKKEEIEAGRGLQLATYAWLLRKEYREITYQNQNSGYFMLAQGELLSDSPLLGRDAVESERPLYSEWLEIWNRGVKTGFDGLKSIREGQLIATGLMEAEKQQIDDLSDAELEEVMAMEVENNGGLYRKPPCSFCDYGILCGMNEGLV